MKIQESFLKIGSVIFNPTQIVSINLSFRDENSAGVSISLSNGEFHFFEEEEAEILKRYFMLGSNVVDLNSFYGGQKC